MPRKRDRERVLGPYDHVVGGRLYFRIVHVLADGEHVRELFSTETEAQRAKEILEADMNASAWTTETALKEYSKYLAEKGTKTESRDVTEWAIELFFPEPVMLSMLSPKRCEALYLDLRTRPRKSRRTTSRLLVTTNLVEPPLPPVSADTHRNALSQTKSFLDWCVKKGWLRENPAAGVEGIGKRRPRGKSLGQTGTALRVKQARAWYRKALELGAGGDEGAIAGLVALLLGLRASEIVSRTVGDLDEDEAPGDLLWIDNAKTPAGRRTLEVPDVLAKLLVECAEGKKPERYLFECERPHELGRGLPHDRGWVIAQVHRICDLAQVPRVTAHAMRGLTATIAGDRGVISHVVAEALGHEHEHTTETAYMQPGAKQAGVNRRGLKVLDGGVK